MIISCSDRGVVGRMSSFLKSFSNLWSSAFKSSLFCGVNFG